MHGLVYLPPYLIFDSVSYVFRGYIEKSDFELEHLAFISLIPFLFPDYGPLIIRGFFLRHTG